MNDGKLTKAGILKFLREHRDFFKKEFAVDNIMLYGSYARGEETDKSDVDVLIKSKVKSFDKQYRLKVFLENNLKKEVDVVYYDSVHPFLMQFIEKDLVYA